MIVNTENAVLWNDLVREIGIREARKILARLQAS